MPRQTHVPTRRRRSRAQIRFHRDRWVAKRFAQYRRVTPLHALWEPRLSEPWGHLEDEQAWLGCSRARCGLCHPDDPGRREHKAREWRRIWEV
jgi:hypothetical protein